MNEARALSGFLNKQTAKKLLFLQIENTTSENQDITLFDVGASLLNIPSISPNTVIDPPISVGIFPGGMAYLSSNNTMYLANDSSPTQAAVSIIDCATNTIIGSPILLSGQTPYIIAYDIADNRMYITLADSGTVEVIDCATNMVIGSPISIGSDCTSIAYDPVHNTMYVTSSFDQFLVIIDCTTNTVTGSISLSTFEPVDIAYDPVHNRMYVTLGSTNKVKVINCITNTVIATINVVGATQLTSIAHNTANNTMYVCSPGAPGFVCVIDCATNTVIVPSISANTSQLAGGIAYDPVNDRMYVNGSISNTVSIINCLTNTVTGSPIAVGNTPVGIAYDILDKRMYISNELSSTVSVLAIDATSVMAIPNGSSIPYQALCTNLSGNPIIIGGMDVYSFSNDYNQIMQKFGFTEVEPDGTDQTTYVYPSINPWASQPSKQNLPIPKDFIADGQNTLSYTILANNTVMIFVRYNQANAQGAEVPDVGPDEFNQDTGKKLIFTGWINSKWNIKLMDLKDIIG